MKLQINKKMAVFSSTVALGVVFAGSAFAAPPDGFGPWADGIAVANQGMRKNGSPVLPTRSDLSAALGVAEGTQDEGTFYSLGMGGTLTLAFQNGISNGVFVVESTWTDYWYPTETAKIEVSTDGIVYTEIGNITKENNVVEVPESISCALFMRITDTSNPDIFEPTADGFDVDGVMSIGDICVTGGEIPACFDVTTRATDTEVEAANEKLRRRKSEIQSSRVEKTHDTDEADQITVLNRFKNMTRLSSMLSR